MTALKDRAEFTLTEIYQIILDCASAKKIFEVLMPKLKIHPVILYILDCGIKNIQRGAAYETYELAWLKKNNPVEYAKRVNTDTNLKNEVAKVVALQEHKAKVTITQAILDYRNSPLGRMVVNGKELGMMRHDNLMSAYNDRRNRSETEFKQSMFFKEIADKLIDKTKFVKDVLTPKDAIKLETEIFSKKIVLV